MMKHIFRYFALVTALSVAFDVVALDLPVKTVNGKQYYYYTVKKGDTLYSLVNRLGVTRSQLVASNPSAADLLKAGDVLYFSVDEYGLDDDAKIEQEKELSGKGDVVCHKVKKGETLYGISRQYNVDQEQIVALNPSARYGVKAGSTLKIPVTVNAEDTEDAIIKDGHAKDNNGAGSTDDVVVLREETAELTPVSPQLHIDSSDTTDVDDNNVAGNVDAEVDATEAGSYSIAVMLPFMLDSEATSRQAALYTDFYKGLMVAADTLSSRGDTVRIYAYDTMGDINRVREILNDDKVSKASVIIAPEDVDQIKLIAGTVKESGTKVLNIFNVKDSSYEEMPAVLQANIPHKKMYAKAVEAISRYFPSHIPVILKNESGKNDKAEFISLLTEYYKSKSIEPIEIVYNGAMVASQFDVLPNDGSQYILIPSSGSLAEFNKFSHALKTVKEDPVGNSRFAVFGYPDWTAFRNDAEEMLHVIDAVVYSRFYYDERGFDTQCLNEAFNRWYGEDMIEVVPNQGMLGFDVGNLLIRNIRNNDGCFNPEDGAYNGAQSSFRFEASTAQDGNGGYFNDEIYILRFKPDGRVERMPL